MKYDYMKFLFHSAEYTFQSLIWSFHFKKPITKMKVSLILLKSYNYETINFNSGI